MKAKTFIFHMLYFPGVFPLIFVSHITPTATTTCCCCTSSTASASASAAASPTPTYRPFFVSPPPTYQAHSDSPSCDAWTAFCSSLIASDSFSDRSL